METDNRTGTAMMEDPSPQGKDRKTAHRIGPVGARSKSDSDVIADMPSLLQRGTIYLIGLILVIGLGLLHYGQVHVVVSARGKIIPEGDVLLVQALHGGVVSAVLARAGDRLPAGAPILRLDLSEVGLNVADAKRNLELQRGQMRALKETAALIESILADRDHFFEEWRAGSIGAVGRTMELLSALGSSMAKERAAEREIANWPQRKEFLLREITITRNTLRLNEKNFENQKRLLANNEKVVAEKLRQLEKYRSLGERKLISPQELFREEDKARAAESNLIQARQQVDKLELEIANMRFKLPDLQRKIETQPTAKRGARSLAEINVKRNLVQLGEEAEVVQSRVDELKVNIATTQERLKMAENQLSLTSVTMPISGMITTLKVHNPGEVVSMGSTVATVVPGGVPLVVEATVQNMDIGFVKPGLAARVKVDAYPFRQFGTAPARVSRVLPDLGSDNTFTIKIQLLTDKLATDNNEVLLFPGLTVEAELLTSKQRLWNLLFEPAVESEVEGK